MFSTSVLAEGALAKTERDFHKFEIRPTPRTLRRPLIIRLLPPHNYYTACLITCGSLSPSWPGRPRPGRSKNT
eukprot:801316-Prorocentrum_minimum.AAC.1